MECCFYFCNVTEWQYMTEHQPFLSCGIDVITTLSYYFFFSFLLMGKQVLVINTSHESYSNEMMTKVPEKIADCMIIHTISKR